MCYGHPQLTWCALKQAFWQGKCERGGGPATGPLPCAKLCPSEPLHQSEWQVRASAAGPKLRKWYGEGERGAAVAQPARPGADGGAAPSVQRTAVLVTDADSATGEQVVLQLILARRGQGPALQGTCCLVAVSRAAQAVAAYAYPCSCPWRALRTSPSNVLSISLTWSPQVVAPRVRLHARMAAVRAL